MTHNAKPITLRYLLTMDEYVRHRGLDEFGGLEVALNLFKHESLQHGIAFGYNVDFDVKLAGKWEEERPYPDTYWVLELTFYDADLATKFKLSCGRPSITIH